MRYWRRGLWVGAVIATGAVAAVALRDRNLDGVQPLLSVLGFLVSLAGLLYNTRRPVTVASPGAQLDRTADALADAVREQWRSEWRLRRLQDPHPLEVHWAPAPAWLSDVDEAIGWPSQDAERPDLVGRLTEITQLFGYLPARRLVVLGAPGSGKTVLALRFTLDLLDRRAPGQPVPVVFQASTWQPDRQDLRQWLAERLVAGYPTLGAEGASGSVPAMELVATGRILPVIDGLDEMAPPLRAKALWRLNTELDQGSPLLLTCRSTVYAEVVESADALTAAAVVELQPLDFDAAAEFLVRTARPLRGPSGERATAWDPVLEHVRCDPDTPASRCLREVLSLPLMVAMARAVYGDTGTDPAELLRRPELAVPAALEQHLLDAFVPASFRTSKRWESADAVHWLRFLARHLEGRGVRDLAWWELHRALPGVLRAVGPLLLIGVVAELICLLLWLIGGSAGPVVVAAAVLLGLCAGHVALSREGVGLGRKVLLSLACVVPLGVVVGGFRPLPEDPYLRFPFSGMDETLGWITVGALYGVAVATALTIIGITTSPTPSTMPFPTPRSRRYGRWLWKTMGGLGVAGLAWFVTSLLVPAEGALLWGILAVGAVVGGYLVRGEGGTVVDRGERRRIGRVRGVGRALVQGLGVGLLAGTVLGLAFALPEGGTAAARAAAQAEFPFHGSVHRAADGSRYVVAEDGTRYGLRADGDTYVERARPVYIGVFEDSDQGLVFTLSTSGEDPCAYETGCRRLRTVVEISVDAKEPESFAMKLPDGRVATNYYVEDIVGKREWQWLARQTPSELLGSALSFGLLGGIGLGIVAGFAAGLHRWLGAPVDVTRTTSPLASLSSDRDTGVVRGFLTTVVGLYIGLLSTIPFPEDTPTAALVFLPTGLIAFLLSAWGRLLTARLWLCPSGRLPWRLMAFLAEAHERGVLRQAGAVYEFRHARLQERLASAPDDPDAS